MIRPGRGLITTMRVEENTASAIECVTKMTVLSVFSQSRSSWLVQMIARDFVEGAERFVHQQQVGLEARARAIDTRCCMPPESCQGNLRSKPRGRPCRDSVLRAPAAHRPEVP
jgi:hypothetical protein